VSERRGCGALRFQRSSHRYRSTAPDQAALRMRIREMAAVRARCSYFRIDILLRREGWRVNPKRVYRIYRQEGLSMRIKRPRRHASAAYREGRVQPGHANDSWSMDFVSDSLFDGRRLRALTIVDNFTRESLAIAVDQGIKGEQERRVLELLAKGKSPAQVARELEISPRTLRNHLHHANQKLHTRNRLEAVMQAARRKLI